MYSHCVNGGWILGNDDRRHARPNMSARRTPIPAFIRIPAGVDEEASVMLSDILPTGFECGVLNGKVPPGSTVAIVGSGPIGLAALLTAQFYSPARDHHDRSRRKAIGVRACVSARRARNGGDGSAAEKVKALTGGRGVDTAIEAVGVPATFELCEELVAPGGTIANIGVHGKKVDLHLETLWSANIAITTGLVDTVSTPMLLKTMEAKKLDPSDLITHRFTLDQILDAYETFGRASETGALKMLISV